MSDVPLTCLDVDIILRSEELQEQLLRVYEIILTRHDDYVAHADFAESILVTVQQLAERVEAVLNPDATSTTVMK
jgi:hypothetical protein